MIDTDPNQESASETPAVVDETDQSGWQRHFRVHPVVFPTAAIGILLLVLITIILPTEKAADALALLRDRISDQFGWLYVLSMNGFLALSIYLAFGRYGDIRLGRPDDRPEFGRLTWFAMLFSAGMGIGLVFWSVAEPIDHFLDAPPGSESANWPSRMAMATTIFHWGLHPWALYAMVALALAYAGFRKGRPLSLRSLLHPLLGRRCDGFLGNLIDILAIVATLTGVATSLGIGAQQVNAGFAYLFGVPVDLTVQVIVIAVITAIATVSVVLGLDVGIRRLSELNIFLATCLMLLVIFGAGWTGYLRGLVDNVGAYLQILPTSSFRTGAYSSEGRQWLTGWTVFFWAWWISWSPFVGMFIARVSRGRTIREFIIGVLLVPSLIGMAWLTAFGNTTLKQHTQIETLRSQGVDADKTLPLYQVAITDNDGELTKDDEGNWAHQGERLTAVEYRSETIVTADGSEQIATLPTVMFVMLDGLFQTQWLVTFAISIATICIILFFVTSSDSASMVIDIIASGGNPNPPLGTRLFWAITEGVVAATLLVVGGLQALQAASIATALPMVLILILACIALLKDLRAEIEPSQSGQPVESR
ncbi:BCCT family transporter [Rhodopirellula halodulae]|uniref:BCCT family transporter n=1 Tax=Rhodopirellula halodulae TaxID=2894198 RepID=UPI001E422404|nr:BCCT family transporter [Rhodopirellula sp. JC737]MCC9655890.1 BCCT family transporter [Rhodopirellula sp. JC737]